MWLYTIYSTVLYVQYCTQRNGCKKREVTEDTVFWTWWY